jgi:hypothetical protein
MTREGLERSRKARWKHGARSREVRELLRVQTQLIKPECHGGNEAQG